MRRPRRGTGEQRVFRPLLQIALQLVHSSNRSLSIHEVCMYAQPLYIPSIYTNRDLRDWELNTSHCQIIPFMWAFFHALIICLLFCRCSATQPKHEDCHRWRNQDWGAVVPARLTRSLWGEGGQDEESKRKKVAGYRSRAPAIVN